MYRVYDIHTWILISSCVHSMHTHTHTHTVWTSSTHTQTNVDIQHTHIPVKPYYSISYTSLNPQLADNFKWLGIMCHDKREDIQVWGSHSNCPANAAANWSHGNTLSISL